MIVAALMLSSVGAFAQNAVGQITLQPKIGLNVANVTDGGDARIGLAAGAELEYGLADIVGISAGAIYSMQGSKGDYGTLKADYINIPIMCNVYVVKGLAVKLGIQPGFKVNDKVEIKTGISGIGDIERDIDLKSFDFSIPVGLSYELPTIPLVIDARYNWGLTEIAKDYDHKNSVFQFTVGYKFAL